MKLRSDLTREDVAPYFSSRLCRRRRLASLIAWLILAFAVAAVVTALEVMTPTAVDENSVISNPSTRVESTSSLLRFFGRDGYDAGLVSWAHAVNSRAEFDVAVADELDFFEADVSMSAERGVPVMAHPPVTESDLTLTEFLRRSLERDIGVKLDFKSLGALRGAESTLASFSASLETRPFWMNADIVGHGTVVDGKIEADDFLPFVKRVTPRATLSVGWNIDSGSRESNDLYDTEDVTRMLDALSRNNVSESVTFAVWSKFVKRSVDNLEWLISRFPDSTVTIWGRGDDASAADVGTIYDVLDKSRVFLDLPAPLKTQIISRNNSSFVNAQT